MQVDKKITISAPLDTVYATYADIQKWRDVLDDVLNIELLYKDPLHEEFLMTVERNGKPETVRSIRYTHRNEKIEIFQPSPPPNFRKMSGQWIFKPLGKGTHVTAQRDFEVKGSDEAKIAQILSGFLERNLLKFKAFLES